MHHLYSKYPCKGGLDSQDVYQIPTDKFIHRIIEVKSRCSNIFLKVIIVARGCLPDSNGLYSLNEYGH